jgi:tetratricopeptide (TPR) repeat protein
VLESTTVPLELYFEHRNYLPAMLLFWPLAHVIVHWKTSRLARAAVAVALLALFAATTWQRATLWGQPDRLAALWVARNPDSPRTQASAALQMMKSGQYQQAEALLRFGMQKNPGEVQLAFNYVNARCAETGLTANDWQAVTDTLVQAKTGHLLINQWLSHAMVVAADQSCPGLSLDVTGRWVVAAMGNPALAAAGRRDEDFEPLLGELAVHQGDPDQALVHFQRALLAHLNPDFAARMVAFLADHEYYQQALALLDTYEQSQQHASSPGFGMAWLHAKVLERQGYWPRELAALRSELAVEMARKNAMTTAP